MSFFQQPFHALDYIRGLRDDFAGQFFQLVAGDGVDVQFPFFGLGLKVRVGESFLKAL